MSPRTFDLHRYTFQFRATKALTFDAYGPGNWLRGVFGSTLRKIACAPDCPGHAGISARQCPHSAGCAYARIFEPVSMHAPSGLADPPRPFAFRVAHLRNTSLAPGDEFHVDVNFFEAHRPALDEFARAFSQVAQADIAGSSCKPLSIPLDPPPAPVTRLRVEFLTPTELKTSERATPLDFSILFARARDRVSTLRSLYGPGALDIDFRALGERARAIETVHSNLQRVTAERRSSRTRHVHSIGGLVGETEYAGDLTEFLPILAAARCTGVGRHCVWGNGEILATPL